MITSKRAYRATEIAPIAISLPFRPTGFFIMPSCSASGLNLRNWFYLTRIHPSTAFTQENYHAQTTVNYTEPKSPPVRVGIFEGSALDRKKLVPPHQPATSSLSCALRGEKKGKRVLLPGSSAVISRATRLDQERPQRSRVPR